MPSRAERITPGIYCAHWLEHVKLDDVFIARDAIKALAAEDGLAAYVLLIDGTEAKTVPLDLRGLTKAVDPATISILVLNAPYSGELMGRMFNQFMTIQAEFFRDRDAWLARAQAILAAHSDAQD